MLAKRGLVVIDIVAVLEPPSFSAVTVYEVVEVVVTSVPDHVPLIVPVLELMLRPDGRAGSIVNVAESPLLVTVAFVIAVP